MRSGGPNSAEPAQHTSLCVRVETLLRSKIILAAEAHAAGLSGDYQGRLVRVPELRRDAILGMGWRGGSYRIDRGWRGLAATMGLCDHEELTLTIAEGEVCCVERARTAATSSSDAAAASSAATGSRMSEPSLEAASEPHLVRGDLGEASERAEGTPCYLCRSLPLLRCLATGAGSNQQGQFSADLCRRCCGAIGAGGTAAGGKRSDSGRCARRWSTQRYGPLRVSTAANAHLPSATARTTVQQRRSHSSCRSTRGWPAGGL